MLFEEYLKEGLGCASVRSAGGSGGGCISQGQAYELTYQDGTKRKVYVKRNSQQGVIVKNSILLFNKISYHVLPYRQRPCLRESSPA